MLSYFKKTKIRRIFLFNESRKLLNLQDKSFAEIQTNNYEKILLHSNKVIYSKDHSLNPITIQKGFQDFLTKKFISQQTFEKLYTPNERDKKNEIEKLVESREFHNKLIKGDLDFDKSLILYNDSNLMRLAILRNYVKLFQRNNISMLNIIKATEITNVLSLYEINFIIFLIFSLNFTDNYPVIDEILSKTFSEKLGPIISKALEGKLKSSFINLLVDNLYDLSDPKKNKTELCLKFYQDFFLSLFTDETISMNILKDGESTIKIMQILYSLNTYTPIPKNILNCLKNREIEEVEKQEKINVVDTVKKLKFYSKFFVNSENKLDDYYCQVLLKLLETNNSISGKLLLTNIINLGKHSLKSNRSILIISKLFNTSYKEAYRMPSSLSLKDQTITDFYIEDFSHYYSNLQFFSNIKIDDVIELIQSLTNLKLRDFELLKISENLIIDHIGSIDNFKQLLKILIFFLDFNVGSDIFYFFLLKRFLEMMNSVSIDENEVIIKLIYSLR